MAAKESKTRTRITQTLVASLKPTGKIYKIYDSEQTGFIVRVSATGTVSYDLRYRSPVDHKDKTYTIGRANRLALAQARKIAKQKAGEVAAGLDLNLAKRESIADAEKQKASTLRAFIDQHYEKYLQDRDTKSRKAIVQDIRAKWRCALDLDLSEITESYVTDWRGRRAQAGIKPSTINRDVGLLKALLNVAVKKRMLNSNPIAGLAQIKGDKNPKTRYLSESEEKRLLAALRERDDRLIAERDSANQWRSERGYELFPAIPAGGFGDHLTPIVLLCMYSGLRRGEALSLEWSELDLQAKRVTVIGEKAKSKSTRHVPLPAKAVDALTQWANQTGEREGLVFKSPVTGGQLDNVRRSWGAVLKAAKIDNFRFHDLRHHYASTLVMRGVNIYTVKGLLGHSDIKLTERYAHLAPEHYSAAVAVLDD